MVREQPLHIRREMRCFSGSCDQRLLQIREDVSLYGLEQVVYILEMIVEAAPIDPRVLA